jgi:hypothetical protein
MNETKANRILSEYCHLPTQQHKKCVAALVQGQKLIYFIQAKDGGPVKIGIAVDPGQRMRHLQNANSLKLNYLWLLPGDERAERKLHHRFRRDHLRGEWFFPSDDLLEYCHQKNPKKGSDAFLAYLLQQAWEKGYKSGHDIHGEIGDHVDRKLSVEVKLLREKLRESRRDVSVLTRQIEMMARDREMTSEERSKQRRRRLEKLYGHLLPEPIDLDKELNFNQK